MAPISLSREDTGKEPAAGLCVSAQGLAQGRSSPCPHPQHHSTSPATQHPWGAPEESDTPGYCAAGQPSQRLLRSLSTLPQGKILDPFRFTTFYIYFALVLCALILSCFKDKPPLFSTENIDPVSLPAIGEWEGFTGCTSAPPHQSHPQWGMSLPQLVDRLRAWMASLPLLGVEMLGDTPDPFVPSSLLLESLPRVQCWFSLPPVFLVVHKVSGLSL